MAYTIQDSPLYFRTGKLPDGSQVMVGIQGQEIIQLDFSAAGELLSVSVYPSAKEELDENDTDLHLNKIHASPGEITINRFEVPERMIGIEDLPEHYRRFLENQEYVNDERRRTQLLSDVSDWTQQGDFVLVWDEEYYLNRDGEIVST